jgi:hypothetical protein
MPEPITITSQDVDVSMAVDPEGLGSGSSSGGEWKMFEVKAALPTDAA